MSKTSRTERDVRERLVDSAAELLAERPPSAITLRDIARQAGLHHSLVTRHFGTKANLVREVVVRFAIRYVQAISRADGAIDSFQAGLDFFLRERSGAAIIGFDVVESGAIDEAPRDYPGLALHISQLEQLEEEARSRRQKSGRGNKRRPRDPRLLAAVVLTLICAWPLLEPWAMSAAGLEELGKDEVRRQLHEIVGSLVAREAGIGVPA